MKIIKIAIVEDQDLEANAIKECLETFSKENDVKFSVTIYKEGLSFLDENESFDLIFMDIEMPMMNGIEVAEKLREKDSNVALIFVTNMAQYAIQGYSVSAIDYVLKPIKYARFSALMKKTLRIIEKNSNNEIILKASGGMKKVLLSDICYIEISDHLLIYHTINGDVEVWGTISGAEEMLPKDVFCRCSHSTIVNFKYIISVEKETIYLNYKEKEIKLSVSHSKKKDFLNKYNKFIEL